MAGNQGPVSGPRLNAGVRDGVAKFYENKSMLLRAMFADGYPPFAAPTQPDVRAGRLKQDAAGGSATLALSPEGQRDLRSLLGDVNAPPELRG